MKINYRIILTILFTLLSVQALAEKNFFKDGKTFYEKKNYEKAKFKFEQDIVQNPKSEKSYLYLAKIFSNEEKFELAENNLNTVILLNPINEEAIYNLAKLKLSSSDYKKSKELNKKLKSICSNFCVQSNKLEIEINNLSKK